MSSNDEHSDLIRARDVSGLDVWALPSFDPHKPEPEPEPEPEEVPVEMEEVPLEEVQPITLEELESIRQEAYNEGFATGEKEGFHSTTLKVRQEAEQALNAKLSSLERLMASLFAPIAEQDTQIEKAMVNLVEHISRQVIQRELSLDSSHVEMVIREALKLLPLDAQNVRLFINPQDFDQVKALRERHEEQWRIVEDASLLPGGLRVETAHSRIDATVETRLKQALDKLFDQLHEQVLHPAAADISLDLAAVEREARAAKPQAPAETQAQTEDTAEIGPDADDAP